MTQNEFIETVASVAVNLWPVYHVLPSVTIAQAIHESGWGKSDLATNANALFGIKAASTWNGMTYTIKTWEIVNGARAYVNAKFRAYTSWEESVTDHAFFLNANTRYKNIIGNTNANEICELLYKDGYATDTQYPAKLKSIISRYNLTKYDLTPSNDVEQKTDRVTYTIQAGDTLSKIARIHNTTVANLAKLNNISNVNYIKAGDVINLN